MKKPKKNVLPFMDFIFLNESEKEKYFSKGSISYISTNKPEHNNIFINNSIEEKEFLKCKKYINNEIPISSKELFNLLDNSINHILLSRPFFSNIKGISLKKMELEFIKKDLSKKGKDFNELFKGCLDCINDK